ncbi:uncharacterized protein LOC119837692 [Zerene cesonia]|uniref:uncharacterized protein LOC119837692 n=1 Tax=Zerene cesonia TaxID=33412 RepID=UPI0018E5849E|nr:uncharacterized protein LOC119837692 [Zerene cesonia]
MLQPRLLTSGSEMGFINCVLWGAVAVLLCTTLSTCQDINDHEPIDATRIKREGVPENRDLTVLLVNDQNRNDYVSKIGRYHSIKPVIGLLTSTARTFIQDGVTTEFATQILGTTLDNGRIYAQVLTKSSLVLYSKPSDDTFVVSPTRLPSIDGWNVKQDLGIIDPDKFVLKNTDYLAPSSKMDIVYASKPAKESFKIWNAPSSPDNQVNNQILEEPTARRVQAYNEIPKFEVYNYLDGPAIDNEKRVEYVVQPSILDNVNTLHRQSKAYEPMSESVKDTEFEEDKIDESNIVKVKPNYDLPTFTIKNEFSPIFYYIDNVESRHPVQQALPETKSPKKLFGYKSEPRPKKTFTYQGFADFTTVVGDTVIIFTPNTDTVRQPNPDEVNVFPSAKPVDSLATKITFLSADIPVATATFKSNEVTKLTTPNGQDDRSDKPIYNGDENMDKNLYQLDDRIPDSVSVQYNNGFDLNLDVIQPSEPAYTTTESTRNTNDLDVIEMVEQNSMATEPLNTINPSSTLREESKESVVTESNSNDLFTNSVEESENTAEEVTETTEEDEEQEEDESTQEMDTEILTTTESGHSDESEEIETTTENRFNKHEEVFCSDGLETQSTMTTAYKTLTYLTTYFIPLESTETTTSVKSDVVVESNVGYLTNFVCKTSSPNIEPTAVINIEVNPTEQSNIEAPEIIKEDYESQQKLTTATEKTPPTTPMEKEILTTVQEEEETSKDLEITPEDEQTTKATTSTTAERVSTSQSHVEVSVSTEHTPTEQVNYKEANEEVNDAENEIDLIYKTLYTTYTYFTTFFGDQTSSVASHKSIVTNIITNTIDLSKMDPSLIDAFNEGEIAPTNVGIGRPTETFAINSIIDLVKNKDVIESVEVGEQYSSQTPTPILGDDIIASIKPDGVKTYFTTYTFFTTIYVGSDANVCSRSEVYTNYVGPDELIPTKVNPLAVENTRAQFDFRNCKQIKGKIQDSENENASMESSVSTKENNLEENSKESSPQPTPVEVDMLLSIDSNPLISENSYVTDVKSSSSKGETKYLDNNNVLDDQISSESNIDEILPSPTLLLQTSYTTFTYFTTMYIGKDSSKVKSRLETITNVVTETITPKMEQEEENNLPITYYTTFTYWTTLYKDKSTTITSREEIVSNIVTPTVQVSPSISPIDTSPIDVENIPSQKELDLLNIQPSVIEDNLEHEDGKATFYTTYTYFTTFYTGNTSQIRSSLETVTNIVDNTKVLEDNQLGRKVPTGAVDKNLIQDSDKSFIAPSQIKEEIKTTKLPDLSSVTTTLLQGTYIDNLFAEVNPDKAEKPESPPEQEKKILFSQVAVISGDSTIVTNDNKTIEETTTTTSTSTSTTSTESSSLLTSNPEVIESSVSEPETTTETRQDSEEEDDDSNTRKRGRLSFTTKKPTFTPVIIPFASRNRPTFSPKRQPIPASATTITRPEFTPTITATPTLKSVRPTGGFGGSRKQSVVGSSLNPSRRFSGRSSATINLSANIPASRPGGFGRASIQPTSRRTGFRSSSTRGNSLDFASRSAASRIRPTASSRLRSGRQSSSLFYTEPNEAETYATQQEENATESLDEFTESPPRQTTNNPLLRFRRPPIARQPGTAITPRTTTPSARRSVTARGRVTTTTTRRTTTRTTNNPLLSLRRQRPNSLFPRRNLFKQPEPEPEEEIGENEQKVDESDEILDEEEFEEDNDYESSDRREQKVATPATPSPKRSNIVSIRPFGFKRRVKRQVDYGNRKFTNFRRPSTKSAITRKAEPEPETEAPAPAKPKAGRYNVRPSANSRSTTVTAPKSSVRQPFIVRGESRTTTTSAPAYRRGKARTSSRTTTISSRPKAPRLSGKSTQSSRSSSGRTTSRSRARTTTSRASSRQRNSFENFSGERHNKYDNILNDGKITITHQLPIEVTIPVVNGKITEYKNILTAKPSIETLLLNQVSTSLGPLGNQQLVLAFESTELADNGATKVTKFVLHETPTTTVIFTPTTIRGRKTSYSHILPSTVYNVEPIVQTVAPEINANVPLANLLLSQLLLGNQQPAINPLLALQGQALLPQQPVVQTPVTEYKTRSTTYVTTVTDARETVLPITFRGTPILTTIVDPTTNVITATEYITDTVVTTPTVLAPPPQFNSLLLPLLLQQQQQQQQQQQGLSLQTANPLLGLSQSDLNALSNNLGQNNIAQNNLNNDIYSNSPKPNILSDLNSNEDFSDDIRDEDEEDIAPPLPPPTRKRHRTKAAKPSPPKQTSVVTLYVSGKHPGEFSTVLSTVVTDDTQTVRKREAIYYEDVQILPSLLPSIDELYSSHDNTALENSILSDMDKYFLSSEKESQLETQSLESIVGSLSNHIKYDASPTYVAKLASPSSIRNRKQSSVDDVSSFNTNAIVYDNTPWRPGRDTDQVRSSEDERKIKNLATRILSNGVEVLVKDKSHDGKQEQRMLKFMHITSIKPHHAGTTQNKSLLSSAVATVVNQQQMSAFFPMHHLRQHNYIIKTCMTTYTYLTTIVQNKRSAISTFETIVSVVTTESLTNLYASDVLAELKPTKTKYMEVKTIQPTEANNIYLNNLGKIDKRIDHDDDSMFDLIQPSEVNHVSCTTTSCSCSHTKTEGLQSKYTNIRDSEVLTDKHATKTTKRDVPKVDIKTTNKETMSMKTKYRPYDYEINSPITPTDRIVEKYTEVISDYSDEKDNNPLKASDLLTNEQAPGPIKTNKTTNNKTPEKVKPDRPQKVNKNKLVVAELIKLGSLGIKGLSQLAPVFEKMTGSFMKRQEVNQTTTSTTEKPVTKLTPYTADKRVDSEETKHGNFPIYIPVDEMETAESQVSFSNVSLHKNYPWAFDHKHSKGHYIVPPKIVQESPLVNGGIPISPGEIIRANSDVIVGKPAVGGPLTLAASGIKFHNPVNRPPVDSYTADSEQYPVNEQYPLSLPQNKKKNLAHVDDSFDLRPPEPPKIYSKPLNNGLRPSSVPSHSNQNSGGKATPSKDQSNKINGGEVHNDHGRPLFLDYIPSLVKPSSTNIPIEHHIEFRPVDENRDGYEVMDSSPSSSEIVSSKIEATDEDISDSSDAFNKPFLVDIQPSRVANVLIPHGSSTALVFAGSSEPHKTGEYIDDPLPYPEPGYFGSFSIDAPQMTNVHSVSPNQGQSSKKPSIISPSIDQYNNRNIQFNEKKTEINNNVKLKWDNNQRFNPKNIPPPMSIQESHVRIGPQITVYKPENYNGDFEKYKQNKKPLKSKDGKEIIDREYENYLAVPPPPPKPQYQENHHSKNKPYNQRPIVHTKPVQDMKVFLNVQHPVPDQLPPKITSEIYFASQPPKNIQNPTYTVQVPKLSSANDAQHTNYVSYQPYRPNNFESNSFSVITSPNIANKSITTNIKNDNTFSVTLNTATGIKNHGGASHTIGASITVPLSASEHNGEINANIPIGTNFAIRVEDDPSKYDTVALNGKRDPSLIYDKTNKNSINNTTAHKISSNESNITKNNIFVHKDNKDVVEAPPPSINSHANFPMINDKTYKTNKHEKPVPNTNDDMESHEQRRPGKIISHIPTNSHGWYSSVLNEDNLKHINNIKVEVTTRKVIPLTYEYDKDRVQDFGPKITTIGKPPTDFLDASARPSPNKFNIGRPFTKQKDSDKPPSSTFTIKPSYIPSIYISKQPVYNIPIVDNSDEVSIKPTENVKPVYETSEEIYDGKEGLEETDEEMSGEVSSESMKVPIITFSSENSTVSKSTNEIIPPVHKDKAEFVKFNPGTQTEKPFRSDNKTAFNSNNMNPIFNNNPYMKPRPFTVNNASPLDHQLQQPHWQINEMMENSTNASYEDSFELNTGEKLNEKYLNKSMSSVNETNVHFYDKQNDSNIITSTIHIKDKKPLLIKVPDRSTLPTFTINTDDVNNATISDIIDLSPPPQRPDYNVRPSQHNELIMGMSPPPPATISINRHPTRAPQTARPVIPVRTPPPYRNVPPRTLPPRLNAQRPVKKPVIINDDVSTYRPTHDMFNKYKRPYFNRDQPSSLLLPPPRELPTAIPELDSVPASTLAASSVSNVIFPTPTSSGWLTSSGVEFSSSFKFNPTSVQYPEIITSSKSDIGLISSDASADNSYSYEDEASQSNDSSESPEPEKSYPNVPSADEPMTQSSEVNKNTANNSLSYESSQEESGVTDNIKITSIIGTRNRTRKPYPIRPDDRKTNKYKPSTKSSTIAPTRTLSRPEVLYPTRQVSIKKIIRPGVSRYPNTQQFHIIESSEAPLDEDFIKPTQSLSIFDDKPSISHEITATIEKTITSTLTINRNPESTHVEVLHHAGNEIRISDEIIPTKTEFKTTVVTLTKTLSEPPRTISSVGYINLTHTLTVTHTKTSLVSQSEGAVTQTLVLTNTHTSTVVDVITEIYTQVQPTTIIETVTKHIPIPQVEATPVQEISSTKVSLDDISMSSEEKENFIIKDSDATENIQKIEAEEEKDNESFFVVMNKSQNGGKAPPISTDIETGDYDGITRNEQVNSNGVSQVLFGEILLAGTPYLETTNIGHAGIGFGKECQPDCKASRNERCQRIDGMMKCVCRPGFARMFPDRPCKPTYTYSVSLVLASQGNKRLKFHPNLADNSTKEYHNLAIATHEGINRMVMQSDLRDVFHGVHITGFHPVEMTAKNKEVYQGVVNDFYVQLSDNAHEYRLKEVIEKYLRNNNYSLGGTEVHAAADLIDRLNVSDFDECLSSQFHDCSEHAKCFNLRGTYTCSCLEGFADLSVNTLYPGRICSSEAVGCDTCNYHGTCFDRESAVICECFKWYAGKTCQINLKAVLITVTVSGLLIIAAATIYASRRCCAPRSPATQTFVIGCMQGLPTLHQGNMPKQRADRRALIAERETAETCSVQNASLPYIPTKRSRASAASSKQCAMSPPPPHSPPPPPAPAVLIPRARLHPHSDSRDNLSRKKSLEACAEAKLISYLESGATNVTEEMRRKHSLESSYSANKDRHNKQGALVSAGFKVSTTVRPEDAMKEDDASSINKTDVDGQLSRFDTLRKSYSQDDNMSEWTDAERRLGELTLSEARSVGGTLPASTGRAASSTRLTHQEANTMAERDLGSTFLLPHVHLYKPDPTSDVSEFDSL